MEAERKSSVFLNLEQDSWKFLTLRVPDRRRGDASRNLDFRLDSVHASGDSAAKSAANSLTSSSVVSHEHINRQPPRPMKE